MSDRAHQITKADLEELEAIKSDLGRLIAPLLREDRARHDAGCLLVARLDRVIRHTTASETTPEGAA